MRQGRKITLDPAFSSQYLWAEKLPKYVKNDRYRYLNGRLKQLYDVYLPQKSADKIYNAFQCYDGTARTDWNDKSTEKLRTGLETIAEKSNHKCSVNDGNHWVQVEYSKHRGDGVSFDCMKLYVTILPDYVSEVFSGAIKYIAENAPDGLAAKVSKFKRNDTACFWTTSANMELLEQYFEQYGELITTPMEWMAYYGKLAVAKEVSSGFGESYNSYLSYMMADYFDVVKGRDDIDLAEMYQMMLDGWNGKLEETLHMEQDFKSADVQILLLLLETLDVLLGRKKMDRNNILMSDCETWGDFMQIRSWEQLRAYL